MASANANLSHVRGIELHGCTEKKTDIVFMPVDRFLAFLRLHTLQPLHVFRTKCANGLHANVHSASRGWLDLDAAPHITVKQRTMQWILVDVDAYFNVLH